MICKYCGADIAEGSAFCTSCGAAVEAETAPETAPETVEVAAEEVVVTESTAAPQKASKTAMILGIVSLVCSLLAPIGSCGYCCCGAPGLLLWIGSIVTAIISFVQAKKNGQKKSGLAIAGLIVSVAFAVLAAIGTVIYVALYGFAAFAEMMGSDQYY